MVQQEADEASQLLYLPAVLHAVGRRSEADEALQPSYSEMGRFGQRITWRRTTPTEVIAIWRCNGFDIGMNIRDPWIFEIVGEHLI